MTASRATSRRPRRRVPSCASATSTRRSSTPGSSSLPRSPDRTMPTIDGTLTSTTADLGPLGFTGFVVGADFEAPAPGLDGDSPPMPAYASAPAGVDGAFELALPDGASGDFDLVVRAPNGAT